MGNFKKDSTGDDFRQKKMIRLMDTIKMISYRLETAMASLLKGPTVDIAAGSAIGVQLGYQQLGSDQVNLLI